MDQFGAMEEVERALRARVDAYVRDLAALVRRQAVEAVGEMIRRGTLTASAPVPSRREGPAPRPSLRGGAPSKGALRNPTRKPGEKRTPALLAHLTEQLFHHIKANPDQRVEQIAVALSVPSRELTLPLRKLLASSRITSRGQKRATRYFPR